MELRSALNVVILTSYTSSHIPYSNICHVANTSTFVAQLTHINFDVITSNISFILGANTQERDVTAGPEKREKVCGASSTRSQAIGYRATRTRIQATD